MKETHSSVSSVDTLDFRYEISAQYPSDTLLKYPSEAQYFQQYRAANKVGCGSVRRGAIIHPSLVLELAGRCYCRNLGIDVYIRRNFRRVLRASPSPSPQALFQIRWSLRVPLNMRLRD